MAGKRQVKPDLKTTRPSSEYSGSFLGRTKAGKRQVNPDLFTPKYSDKDEVLDELISKGTPLRFVGSRSSSSDEDSTLDLQDEDTLLSYRGIRSSWSEEDFTSDLYDEKTTRHSPRYVWSFLGRTMAGKRQVKPDLKTRRPSSEDSGSFRQRRLAGKHQVNLDLLKSKYSHKDKVLEELIRGTDVNIQNKMGKTPLHIALDTFLCYSRMIRNRKADLEKERTYGDTTVGKIPIFSMNNQDNEGNTALHIAVGDASRLCVPALEELIRTTDVNKQDNEGGIPLHIAAENRNIPLPVLEQLMKKTIDVNLQNKEGRTPLHLAANQLYYGPSSGFEELIRRTNDVNIQDNEGRTPLHIAATYWHFGASSVIEELIRRTDDVNIQDNKGNTAVHIALEEENTEFVEIMLQHSANLDIKNEEGRTPLHLAAKHWYRAYSSVFEELIRRTNDVNIKDNEGNTAVHIGVEKKNTEFVQIMLKHSANLDIKNEEGRTPLHLAAKHWYGAHSSVFEELIRRTNDVNIKDNNGNTALHIAFIMKNDKFIQSLLISAARLDVKNNKHDTVLDLIIRAIADPDFVLGGGRDFVICLLKALICGQQYGHIPKILCEVSKYKDAVIDTILDYTQSQEMLKERASCIHVADVELDVNSNDCFIQSCLGLSSVANYIDDRDRHIAALFQRTVSRVNIRGIQVCLRAVIDISREDILQSLSDAAWKMKNLEVVKCIINAMVLTKDEIDEITRPEGKQDDSKLTPDLSQVFSDLEIKSSVLERFVSENKGNLIDAYFGRDNTAESNTSTLVAIFKCPPFTGIPDTEGFPLRFTHAFSQYKESIEAEYGNGRKEQKVDEDVVVNIKSVISNKVDYLMKNHRNLNIVRRSSVISKAKSKSVEEHNCILLSCYEKGVIPDGDLPFPTSLEGIPVDVREGAFDLYAGVRGKQNAANVQTSLKMGCMISKSVNDNCGTMGGFVTEQEHLCFLTCSHVLHDIGACTNDNSYNLHGSFDVMEAGFNGDFTKCGEHVRSVLDLKSDVTIDASLVKICPSRKPIEGQFRYIPRHFLEKSGFDEPPVFNEGECRMVNKTDVHKLFMKIGAISGITRGCLEVFGTAARIRSNIVPFNNKTPLIYKGQYEFSMLGQQQFAAPGDSGALVFSVDPAENNSNPKLTCLGMVVGGTTDLITLVTPIGKILEKLGLNTDKMAVFKTDGDMEVDV